MRNWDVFIIISVFIIGIMLFASGKVSTDAAFQDANALATLIAMGKTLLIIFTAIALLAPLALILLLDIFVSIIIKKEFPLSNFMYEKVYLQFARGWYWDEISGSNILLACIILFGLSLIYAYAMPKRTKRLRYNFRKPKRIYL